MTYDYVQEPVPVTPSEWWADTFPQHQGRQQVMNQTVGNILNVEAADPNSPAPDEGEIGFVIQVGPRIFAGENGLFETDDDAHMAAIQRGFADFNIKPVLPL